MTDESRSKDRSLSREKEREGGLGLNQEDHGVKRRGVTKSRRAATMVLLKRETVFGRGLH